MLAIESARGEPLLRRAERPELPVNDRSGRGHDRAPLALVDARAIRVANAFFHATMRETRFAQAVLGAP